MNPLKWKTTDPKIEAYAFKTVFNKLSTATYMLKKAEDLKKLNKETLADFGGI